MVRWSKMKPPVWLYISAQISEHPMVSLIYLII